MDPYFIAESSSADFWTALGTGFIAFFTLILALIAVATAWALFPREPKIYIRKTLTLKDIATWIYSVNGKKDIINPTFQVHFWFRNNNKDVTVEPTISLRVPIECVPILNILRTQLTTTERNNNNYVPLFELKRNEIVASEDRIIILDPVTKEPLRDIHSDEYKVIEREDLPDNYRRFYFKKPIMEPGLSYPFWVRLAVPVVANPKRPITLSVTTPYFRHKTCATRKFTLHMYLPFHQEPPVPELKLTT